MAADPAELAAAAYLIRDAKTPGPDIAIYEASDTLGGGFFLGGDAQNGYNIPGSVFDAHFRCAFNLLDDIPSRSTPGVSVKKEFFDFNASHPFQDLARIVDGAGQVVPHQRGFGLRLLDAWNFLELAFAAKSTLDGRRIEEFFSQDFFCTEFWLLWSTLMGSLPEQSAIEFRRYLIRTLGLFPNLYDMAGILRTPHAQHQSLIDPLVAWLDGKQVKFVKNAAVTTISLAQSPGSITVTGIEFVQDGATQSVAIAPDDILLVTTGSQIANFSTGTQNKPASPSTLGGGSSLALWRQLASLGADFGNPDVFFDQKGSDDWRWVSFTVTTTASDFLNLMAALTGSPSGTAGLVTLRDSPWLISLTIFEQPEVTTQPKGVSVWWGYGLRPERNGHYVKKPMVACSGAEILEEVVKQLKFDANLQTILGTSTCIPCIMPYVNNIWAPRSSGDRPQVVPDGATNLGLIGQYVEVQEDIAFTMEYSARTAWEAVHLLRNSRPPPPVYQATTDPGALLAALTALLGI